MTGEGSRPTGVVVDFRSLRVINMMASEMRDAASHKGDILDRNKE